MALTGGRSRHNEGDGAGATVAVVLIAVKLPATAPVASGTRLVTTRIESCKENDASNNFWCTTLVISHYEGRK